MPHTMKLKGGRRRHKKSCRGGRRSRKACRRSRRH